MNDVSLAEGFAEELIRCGWEIIATSETVELLSQKGLPVQDIAEFTGVYEDYGFPPTLHAKVEDALTRPSEYSIDLVYVIPYPLAAGNDIGGRTLLGLAVKGGRTAVMSIEDMKRVVHQISSSGDVAAPLRLELADKACAEIARHFTALIQDKEDYDILYGRRMMPLKNGENPYQVPASAFDQGYEDDPLSLMKFKKVSGELPCFTNLADADAILQTLCLAAEAFRLNTVSEPRICIAAKHGNPCGMAVHADCPERAIEWALFGDPNAIWGGEVITNFSIDEGLATLLRASSKREQRIGVASWMLDLVIAPSFTPGAIHALGNRLERKLYENSALESPSVRKDVFFYRFVRGGFLRQPPAYYILDLQACDRVGESLPLVDTASLIVAWSVAFSSSHGGNEVALAKNGILLGAGGGPSTVEAAKVAVMRAEACGHDVRGAVFAADAFFPFTDGPSILAKAGVIAGCVPAGGKRGGEVRDFFLRQGISMAYLPEPYRGFCRH
ncbi:MAG: hypothetical protein PHN75_12135 [Syntrophales bacterium]|nr:hypothetical protein [Syntrophales bacterium]